MNCVESLVEEAKGVAEAAYVLNVETDLSARIAELEAAPCHVTARLVAEEMIRLRRIFLQRQAAELLQRVDSAFNA